jgi:hypothetical protein
MTCHLNWFSQIQEIPKGQWPICGISSQIVYARGIGCICINSFINVLYILDLTSNLFSLSRIATKGVDTTCSRNRCYLTIGDTIMMEGVMDNMLYCLVLLTAAYILSTLGQVDYTMNANPYKHGTAASATLFTMPFGKWPMQNSSIDYKSLEGNLLHIDTN